MPTRCDAKSITLDYTESSKYVEDVTYYHRLAWSIIRQAIMDYQRCRKALEKAGKENIDVAPIRIKKLQKEVKACEKFFRSQWFTVLSGTDGEWFCEVVLPLYEERGYIIKKNKREIDGLYLISF